MSVGAFVAFLRLLRRCGPALLCAGLALGASLVEAQTILASATWSATGHTYHLVEFAPGADQTWAAARSGVTQLLGPQHQLATITNAGEDAFVRELLGGRGWEVWIGGSQPPTETNANAGWAWVTGEAFEYTNWCSSEPNDAYVPAREQHLALDFGGMCWNDEGSAIVLVRGYVAETVTPVLLSLDSVFGPDTLTVDTHSALRWLDVPISGPYSYDGIAARVADRASPFSGYRIATMDEVLALLRHAGIPPASGLPTDFYAPIRNLMAHVGLGSQGGNLGTGFPFDFTFGHVLGKQPNGWVDGITIAAYSHDGTGWVEAGSVPSDNDNPEHGTWLIAVPVPLHVTRTGTGLGSVASDVPGIVCGDDCDETYAHGTVVTLTAEPAPGHRFSGWAGACSSTLATCQVLMEAVRDVTATFALPRPYTVTASKRGPGAGAVTSTPPGIDCGDDCQGEFLEGTTVNLTASAGPGSAFAGWSGPCRGKGPCALAIADHTSVQAAFADAATDHDADLLPDEWEVSMGLDPTSDSGDSGPNGDPDHDGKNNLEESQAGTHPLGLHARYFAEGATIAPFRVRFALLNPGSSTSHALLRFLSRDGTTVTRPMTIAPATRETVDCGLVPDLLNAEFSTVVESDTELVADRAMVWDAGAYGGHAETGIASPAPTWYLAEGATHSGFDLFYLLQNPGDAVASVRITYLRPSPAPPLTRSYTVAPLSRYTVWVDQEDAGLASTDVSAVIEAGTTPIIVERAMYLSNGSRIFDAGHESAGVTAPATRWFLAEGATGPMFDYFVLIANPNGQDADVQVTFLRPDGMTVTKNYRVAARSRYNVWVDLEDALLSDTAVSAVVESTTGLPIVVERAMWWPGDGWHGAHSSPGATTTGTGWALAEGEVDATRGLETYILIVNTADAPADVKVTLLIEGGTRVEQTYLGLPGRSRFNVPVGGFFPESVGRRFGALVESVGTTPAPIVVERSMYWNALGESWGAGTNALATRLR